ncbi:MAG: RAD55 family ATPase, partial [Candidatus Cloacimonetes bacterium]|nr:RAD55 family ATPase [Candidatus Cloacimonadota bacterium]
MTIETLYLQYEPESIKLLRKLEKYIKEEYAKKRQTLNNNEPVEIKFTSEEIEETWKDIAFKDISMIQQDNLVSIDNKINSVNWKYVILYDILSEVLLIRTHFCNRQLKKMKNQQSNPIDRSTLETNGIKNLSCVTITVKSSVAIPKDFVASYFGFDTGIDGLNRLMNGGFLLPPDRPSYIAVSGESGVGKTTFITRLVTAFHQNGKFKSFFVDEEKKLKKPKGIKIYYILIEQSEDNVLRIINDFKMLKSKNNTYWNAENIEEIIQFKEVPIYSAEELLEKIQEIKYEDIDYRKVIIVDSINALQDFDVVKPEWREFFQAIKAIIGYENFISFFIQERHPEHPDVLIEYVCDVVIRLHRKYIGDEYTRIIEILESRFASIFLGKHPFYLVNTNSILVYPNINALHELIPHRKRIQSNECKDMRDGKDKKNYGLKISGILNFYKYTHSKPRRMKPYWLKNTLTILIGDYGCHKSNFAELFALSAFRDEDWVTTSNSSLELDPRY